MTENNKGTSTRIFPYHHHLPSPDDSDSLNSSNNPGTISPTDEIDKDIYFCMSIEGNGAFLIVWCMQVAGGMMKMYT